MPHKGTIKSFDSRTMSGYIMPATRRSSLVFNVVDVKVSAADVPPFPISSGVLKLMAFTRAT